VSRFLTANEHTKGHSVPQMFYTIGAVYKSLLKGWLKDAYNKERCT